MTIPLRDALAQVEPDVWADLVRVVEYCERLALGAERPIGNGDVWVWCKACGSCWPRIDESRETHKSYCVAISAERIKQAMEGGGQG